MINLEDVSYRYSAGMEALSHISAEISPGIYFCLERTVPARPRCFISYPDFCFLRQARAQLTATRL